MSRDLAACDTGGTMTDVILVTRGFEDIISQAFIVAQWSETPHAMHFASSSERETHQAEYE